MPAIKRRKFSSKTQLYRTSEKDIEIKYIPCSILMLCQSIDDRLFIDMPIRWNNGALYDAPEIIDYIYRLFPRRNFMYDIIRQKSRRKKFYGNPKLSHV